MLYYLFIFLLFIPLHVFSIAKEESDEIVIRLATENQLIPIYLAKFTNDNSTLSSEYVNNLEQIMQFDLNHNGMTYTISQNNEREKLTQQMTPTANMKSKQLQTLNAFYIVKVQAKAEKKLSLSLIAVNGDTQKSLESINLTGKLDQDRKLIHQLSDAIHKALFGKEGIASTRILYTIKKQGPNNKPISDVWVADYDGENAQCLIKNNALNITPTFIPPKSGNKAGNFLYVSYKTGQPKIYLASLNNPTIQRLSLLHGNQLMPVISHQRDHIAFICDVTGNPDLFLQSFDPEKGLLDKPRQIFAGKKATQGTPTFSPDGKKIAFVSNKDGVPRIYVMDIPKQGKPLKDISARLATKHSKESSAPAWSPDGSKLAYCALANGVRQIWIYDLNTQEERQLTQGPGNKENPTWAPNSLSLMYNSSNSGNCELYLININQPKATKITSGPGEKRFPSWEPRST